MNAAHLPDPLMNALATLPAVEPDRTRSEAVRARCRAVLEGQERRDVSRQIEPAAAGIACAYAWQVAKLALLLVR
jgi:hypothetical protein